jgi:hypothetical protein
VLVAQFGDGDVSGNALATFYHRDEIVGRGVGVVFLLAAGNDNREPLLSLELEFREFTAALRVSDRGADDEAALLQALRPILFDGELQPDRGGLRSLLFGKPETPQAVVPVPASIARGMSGHVDFYGYHPQAQVWLFCGWVAAPWSDSDKPTNVVARFSNGLASGDATLAAFYYRDDIQAQGVGFILSLASADGDRNHLAGLELEFAETTMLLPTTAAGPGLTARQTPTDHGCRRYCSRQTTRSARQCRRASSISTATTRLPAAGCSAVGSRVRPRMQAAPCQ